MIRDLLRTRLADALAHTLATKPFELTPSEDLERQVNLAMADAVLVVVAEWLRDPESVARATRVAVMVTEDYVAERTDAVPSEANLAVAILADLAESLAPA